MSRPTPAGGRRTTSALSVRWSRSEADTVRYRAALAGLSVSDYVRRAVLGAVPGPEQGVGDGPSEAPGLLLGDEGEDAL